MDKKSFKKLDSYFKSLLDNMIEGVAMHEMIFDKDNNPIDYKILDVNLSFEKILGLKKDDVNGKLASEIYGYVPALKEYSDVVINKKSLKFKLCHKTKYFDISVSPWNDVGFITIFYDITDRFEIENALKESEFFVRSIVESASLGIIVYDINLNYVLWNPFMEQLTGVKASEIIGKNALTSFHHIKDNNLDVLLYKALNGEECRSEDIYYELPKLKKSGWGVTNYGPLKDTKGEIIGVVAFIKDITDRKNFENEIIKAKDKAEKSEQMKITFLSNMSHELRTPINSIIGFSEILKEDNISKDRKIEYLDIIMKNGDILTTLINDIIDISKIDSHMLRIERTEINLNKFIQDLKSQYSKEIKLTSSKLKLNIDIDLNSNVFILADKYRLKQILLNLINNSIKFTKKGYVKFGYEILDNNKLQIYVKDTGIGISEENQKIIFNRFVQINDPGKKTKGSGLGLAISKSLSEMMNFGEIKVNSELGKGSCFYFITPFIIKDDNQIIENDNKDDIGYDFTGVRVLIIEDDIDSNKILKLYMRSANATVFASYGSDAMDIIKNKNIDVVLLDLGLLDISGYDILKDIKEFNENIKVIIESAYVVSEYRNKAFEMGADDFVSKPFNKSQIYNAILKQI